MQILKGKKDSMPEINPFASEKDSVTISLDKWASDAKAYKQAYEAGKSEDPEADYTKARWEIVNELINNYPPNFATEIFPEAVTEDGYWNKDVLFTTTALTDRWQLFKFRLRSVLLEYANWDGISDPLALEEATLEYFKTL